MSFSTLSEGLEILIGLVFLSVFCLFLIALYSEESRSRGTALTNDRRALSGQRPERDALLVLIGSKSSAALNKLRSPNGHRQD
jgi:hypothetical protein